MAETTMYDSRRRSDRRERRDRISPLPELAQKQDVTIYYRLRCYGSCLILLLIVIMDPTEEVHNCPFVSLLLVGFVVSVRVCMWWLCMCTRAVPCVVFCMCITSRAFFRLLCCLHQGPSRGSGRGRAVSGSNLPVCRLLPSFRSLTRPQVQGRARLSSLQHCQTHDITATNTTNSQPSTASTFSAKGWVAAALRVSIESMRAEVSLLACKGNALALVGSLLCVRHPASHARH